MYILYFQALTVDNILEKSNLTRSQAEIVIHEITKLNENMANYMDEIETIRNITLNSLDEDKSGKH